MTSLGSVLVDTIAHDAAVHILLLTVAEYSQPVVIMRQTRVPQVDDEHEARLVNKWDVSGVDQL